jgi:hypothetical protein
MEVKKTKAELYNDWIETPGNREKKIAKNKEWRDNNKKRILEYRQQYRANPVVKVYEQYMRKLWLASNPEKAKAISFRAYVKQVESGYKCAYDAEYRSKTENKQRRNDRLNFRFHNDEQYRIGVKVSGMTHRYLKGVGRRNEPLIGCSVQALRNHFESQFTDGMSWLNYGEWEIDHILPLTSFNLTNREEYLKCVHYTNLQPLWVMDNLKKGNKILKAS